jgi:hypothetical protein
LWGLPPELLEQLPGYGPDVAGNRAEARRIMQQLGYAPDKPLAIKLATRNIANYRDSAVEFDGEAGARARPPARDCGITKFAEGTRLCWQSRLLGSVHLSDRPRPQDPGSPCDPCFACLRPAVFGPVFIRVR